MELRTKILYRNLLLELIEIEKKCNINNDSTSNLLNAVDNMPLLVPVVGEFSAGKSSLLNACIGKNILSVGMAPETAKPAELYYSEKEYNESIDKNGNATPIIDINNPPTDCVCFRRYINSEFLKKIEPIVLVDMPGFDSPHDAHNQAIFNYLDKGSHYVVLTDVRAGTVSRSMVNQIQNILAFGKNCSFFLSKCDLKSSNEIEDVKLGLENELESIVGECVNVSKISKNDISMFNSFATGLNADAVFKTQFFESVKEELYKTKDSINTKIAALKKEKNKNANTIEELKTAQKKLEAKKTILIENAQKKSYTDEAETVANAVGSELSNNIDTLTETAFSSGQQALQEEINSIIQTTAVTQMQTVIHNISVRISGEFSKEVKNLSEILAEYGAPNALEKIQGAAKNLFDAGKTNITNWLNKYKIDSEKADTGAKDLSTVADILGIATEVLASVIEVVLMLLPSIINAIYSKAREQKQKQEIREAISNQIPVIKRSVREKIAEILKENANKMIEQISGKFDEEIKAKENEISAAMAELENNTEVEQKIAVYQASFGNVDNLLNKIL